MYPLLETIRLQDGAFFNLSYHIQRMTQSCIDVLKTPPKFSLQQILNSCNPPRSGLYKCRVLYGADNAMAEFNPYTISSIRSLKVIHNDSLEYPYKFSDRSVLNHMFGRRGTCDDCLIIKNGRVTDTTYTNIAFYEAGTWLTPDQPLLKGTMRQLLLDRSEITTGIIRLEELGKFQFFKTMNAMMVSSPQPISQIKL